MLSFVLYVVAVTSLFDDVTGQYCVSNKTCNGHGYCPNSCQSQCQCMDYYTGDYCEIPPICVPGSDQCGVNGECYNCAGRFTDVQPRCLCNSGYTGRYCDIAPICSEETKSCDNGYCDFTVSPRVCVCQDGYNGTYCGNVVQDAAPMVSTALGLVALSLAGGYSLRK